MFASLENHPAASAIGIRFSAHTEYRRKHHINQRLLALFVSAPSAKQAALSLQILRG
jgi:hypothetical protein